MNDDQARSFIERQARAWEAADLDAIAADFAPDGVFISPGGRWQGPNAIHAAAESFFGIAKDVKVTITRVLVSGDSGAAEWIWSETRRASGTRHQAEDAVVFVLRADQIIYWREYFDSSEMEKESQVDRPA